MEKDEPGSSPMLPESDDLADEDSREAIEAASESNDQTRPQQKDTNETGVIITPDSPAHNSQTEEVSPNSNLLNF